MVSEKKVKMSKTATSAHPRSSSLTSDEFRSNLLNSFLADLVLKYNIESKPTLEPQREMFGE